MNIEGGFIPDVEKMEFSEERLGSLYAALGNNEAKAITFLVMKPGVIYDDNDILTEVRKVQGNSQEGWRMGNEGPYHYLQKSFAPVGLVAQEVTDRQDNKYGYIRTSFGDAIGNTLAGKMLQLSHNHPDFALYDIFGSTVSTSKPTDVSEELKKRSPLSRIYLFRALLSSGDREIALKDLAGKIGENDVTLVHRHLKELDRSGLVKYDNDKNAIINPETKDLLFTIIQDFQNILSLEPSTLQDGKLFAANLMSDPDSVARLMKKAKEHSRNANQVPLGQTAEEITVIIESHPGITTSQVRNLMEEVYAHTLSEHRVRRIIATVMDRRGVPWPRGGRNIKWSLS